MITISGLMLFFIPVLQQNENAQELNRLSIMNSQSAQTESNDYAYSYTKTSDNNNKLIINMCILQILFYTPKIKQYYFTKLQSLKLNQK